MDVFQRFETNRAIDVHAHFGRHRLAPTPKDDALSGGPDLVVQRHELAGIRATIVSSMDALDGVRMEYSDLRAGNAAAQAAAEEYDSIWFYAILNPTFPRSFDDVAELLEHPKCLGIKIHPRMHQYEISEYGQAVFEFAADRQTVVLSHSGGPGCLPCQFIPFMNAIPEAKLILAHLGHDELNGTIVLQTDAIKQAQSGNVYTDTSSSSSIYSGLIEYAVNEIGADRILFGTDSPSYFSAAQKRRIELAEIDQAAKQAILWENAQNLFGSKLSKGCDQ